MIPHSPYSQKNSPYVIKHHFHPLLLPSLHSHTSSFIFLLLFVTKNPRTTGHSPRSAHHQAAWHRISIAPPTSVHPSTSFTPSHNHYLPPSLPSDVTNSTQASLEANPAILVRESSDLHPESHLQLYTNAKTKPTQPVTFVHFPLDWPTHVRIVTVLFSFIGGFSFVFISLIWSFGY